MAFSLCDDWTKAIEEGGTLCISHGKDSLACLRAIELLGWKLKRIVHAEVWATDTIPGDLPPMVEFKKKADKIIKERWGIEVERVFATDENGRKLTYEKIFYNTFKIGKRNGTIYGFPFQKGPWCNSRLKMAALANCNIQGVEYIGIANDEPKRFKILNGSKLSPLRAIGWEEDLCGLWATYSDLLSPTYCDSCRDGCWFCHNQGVEQLRSLRRKYPHLWELLLKWDKDSPVTFKADGHTVHDYDERFALEDEGLILPDQPFRWDMLQRPLQYSFIF